MNTNNGEAINEHQLKHFEANKTRQIKIKGVAS